MVANLRMFALNISFLIGILLALVILAVAVIVACTGVNLLVSARRRRHAERDARRRRFGPDGRPYPPAGRGFCGACQRAGDVVYHLPNGERLCPACYALRDSVTPGSNGTTR